MKSLLIGINSKYIHPAMGVFQLYTNSRHPVSYKEFTIKDDKNEIINYINNDDSRVVGISLYIWNVNVVKEILPSIKNKIIFLGGPEASFNPHLLTEFNISYIIKGEGEESFNELIDYLDGVTPINNVSNLYYVENNKVNYTFDKLPNLDNIKHDLSLISDFKNRICYIESSRGCFYNCSYCLASTEKPVRYFPLSEVLDNIKFLLENNAKVIKFLDRSFGVRKEYINGILSFIKENDNGVSTFQFEVNADTLAIDTISLLASMRPKSIRLEVGIQSTNPKTIKAINRHQDFNKLVENINKIKDNVVIHTDLIAGLPYEDYESFKNSYNQTFLLFTEELQLGFLKELKGTVISLTKDLYDYKFMDYAPYEVISNKYIDTIELDKIRLVEIATDKFYNYGYFKKTINYLFKDLLLNPFETFYQVMNYINNKCNIYSLQFDELTKIFYEALSQIVSNKEELLFILKEDYLTKTKMKPKIWWVQDITRPIRKMAYEMFSKKYNLNIDELYKYAHLEKYHNSYLLINYKTNITYHMEIKDEEN